MMRINPISLSLRARKLGVLIRDARQSKGKSLEACAQSLGIEPDLLEAWELGEQSPSMPEIEHLAYSLNVPLEHFWEDRTLSAQSASAAPQGVDLARLATLRHRMIGVRLRQARQQAGLSLEALAEKAWSSPTLLESYELGETPVPLPDLEVLCSVLGCSLKELQDQHGPVGTWAAQQKAVAEFLALSPEMQAFVSKPINRPYLELAQRLSDLSVEKLRAVGEVLLEITL